MVKLWFCILCIFLPSKALLDLLLLPPVIIVDLDNISLYSSFNGVANLNSLSEPLFITGIEFLNIDDSKCFELLDGLSYGSVTSLSLGLLLWMYLLLTMFDLLSTDIDLSLLLLLFFN